MSDIDLDRWEPFDQGEFPEPTSKAGLGLCSWKGCEDEPVWMRFVVTWGDKIVRGQGHCHEHALIDSRFSLARKQAGMSQGNGAVYYALRDGRIKIGTSTNVAVRIDGLRAELLAHEPGSYDVERARHIRFAHLRIAGEWFHPGADLLAHIDTLRAVAA